MRLFFVVIFLHIFGAFLLLFYSPSEKLAPKKEHLKVHSLTLISEPLAFSANEKMEEVPKEEKKITLPPKKVDQPKAPPIKKKISVSKPPEKEKNDTKNAIIAEIAKSLQSVQSPSDTRNTRKMNLPALACESKNFKSVSYEDLLTAFLENNLEFPEPGKIRARLTINKNGSLKEVEIIESPSKKNALYLQQQLLSLLFPLFQNHYPKEEYRMFPIVLNVQ